MSLKFIEKGKKWLLILWKDAQLHSIMKIQEPRTLAEMQIFDSKTCIGKSVGIHSFKKI